MMHIPYALNASPIHGVGVFATTDLSKGTLLYTPSPLLDVNLTQEEFDSLSENEQKEVQWWGFFDTATNRWHVDFDVTHFINHATNATITQDTESKETRLIAARDIKVGEELTQNYLEFESEEDLRRRGIVLE